MKRYAAALLFALTLTGCELTPHNATITPHPTLDEHVTTTLPICFLVAPGVNNDPDGAVFEAAMDDYTNIYFNPTNAGWGSWSGTQGEGSPLTLIGYSLAEDSDIWNSPGCLPESH